MNKFIRNTLIACAALSVVACGRVETGYVGVRTEFNKTVNSTVLPEGFYTAFFSSVDQYVVKEIEVKFDNLTPKGKDNLILADFDVSIFYQPNAANVAKMGIKYSGMSAHVNGVYYPSFNLVERTSRGAVFDVVSEYDSLTIHTKRTELESAITARVQRDLDQSDPGEFKVTKVIVRQIKTDPALEASIQRAVQVQKDTEAKRLEVELAKAEAERLRVQSAGQAVANQVLANSLTDNFIRYQQVLAMRDAAKVGTVVMMPMDTKTTPILNLAK